MNSKWIFRRAGDRDVPRILEIIRTAQAQMRAAGSRQWQNGYPAEGDIRRDLACGYGYVLCCAGAEAPAAYGAVVFDGEPAYGALEGRWTTPEPYVVLHRMAVAGELQRRGAATEFLHRVADLALRHGVRGFRVDTNFDNVRMLHLLEREAFAYCGKVHYESGERLAFDKNL